MPPKVFDTITSLLDHHENLQGVDYRKAIFLFLSNNGGVEIADTLHEIYRKGKLNREATSLKDFEKVLELAVYNKKGGLQYGKPIENSLIDHYIPFLPLEKRHVQQCIEAEFSRLYVRPTQEIIK